MIWRFVAGLALIIAFPVAAGADELADYMESAMHAEFHGSGIVMSSWGTDTAAMTYEVTRTEGMSVAHGPGGDLMLSGGVMASFSGTDWYALEVADWSTWEMSDRYSLGEARPVTRLGRPASERHVMEGDIVRARLVIDDASTVPLLIEVFDADGELFRTVALTDLAEAPGDDPEMPVTVEHEMMMTVAPSELLPAAAGAYRRVDSYGAGDAATQAFYSDGLFSFSVFESARGAIPAEFADASTFEAGDGRYRRIVSPSHIWVQWSSPDRSYVLVGDLPPDHVVAVLEEMPKPGVKGAFMRLLGRIFG